MPLGIKALGGDKTKGRKRLYRFGTPGLRGENSVGIRERANDSEREITYIRRESCHEIGKAKKYYEKNYKRKKKNTRRRGRVTGLTWRGVTRNHKWFGRSSRSQNRRS